jgi:Ca2+-binding RTX toxin-like protein
MRSRTVLLLTTMAAALVMASGIALAATIECPNRSGNLCVGTKRSDIMTGTNRADDMLGRGGMDRMRARGGNDTIDGDEGRDVIRGRLGNDRIKGGDGRDKIYGGAGSDTIFTGGVFIDLVDCGPGTDSAFVDSRDRVVRCERVVVER